MGRLSTQKNPMSSKTRLTVLFPEPESPVMITMRKFFRFLSSHDLRISEGEPVLNSSGIFPFPHKPALHPEASGQTEGFPSFSADFAGPQRSILVGPYRTQLLGP
jgi:hypothetical protein